MKNHVIKFSFALSLLFLLGAAQAKKEPVSDTKTVSDTIDIGEKKIRATRAENEESKLMQEIDSTKIVDGETLR